MLFKPTHLRRTVRDQCVGWGFAGTLRFGLIRCVGQTENLAGRQRGQRKSQLVTRGEQHHIIVERSVLQQVDLWFWFFTRKIGTRVRMGSLMLIMNISECGYRSTHQAG